MSAEATVGSGRGDPVTAPVFGEIGRLSRPGLVVHGGAGDFHDLGVAGRSGDYEEGMRAALEAGWQVLAEGGLALDAVVEAVAALEDSGRFNAGRGAVPTIDGAVEFDASVMDGATREVGAICAATWPANPVRVAREVAHFGGVPDGPLLLAGRGADRFARERGFTRMDPSWLTGVEAATRDGDARTGRGAGGGGNPRSPQGHQPEVTTGPGTVGAVAVDADGQIAAATSTGGRRGQLSGRVGDSAIPGAGVWAAPDTAAVSATGSGEAFIVAGFGRMIDLALRHGIFRGEGVPAEEALAEGPLDEATLEEALLDSAVAEALQAVAGLGGQGGGIAVTPAGAYAARFTSAAMARGWRDDRGASTRIWP